MKAINPKDFKRKDFPIICLSDNRRSFIGFAIKAHSKGQYSHVMEITEKGYFASQQFTGYKRVPYKAYMKPNITLKFFRYKDMNKIQKTYWIDLVDKELKEPWWRIKYDLLGILGIILPFKWTRKLNNPWAKYCSERVAGHELAIMKVNRGLHPTPVELNNKYKNDENVEYLGHYFFD